MKRFLSLLSCALLLPLAVQAAGDPRIGYVLQPCYTNIRMEKGKPVAENNKSAEFLLNLADKANAGLIRTGFPIKELVAKDGINLSRWGRDEFLIPTLDLLKRRGFRVHVTLGMDLPHGCTEAVAWKATQLIIDELAKRWKPGEWSLSVENEPAGFISRLFQDRLARFWHQVKDYLREQGHTAAGVVLYSPTVHGWLEWNERLTASRETYAQLRLLDWLWEQEQYRWALKAPGAGLAFHNYLNGHDPRYKADTWAAEKSASVIDHMKAYWPALRFMVTEANVLPYDGSNDYLQGYRLGMMVRAMLKDPRIEAVVIYSLNEHVGFCLVGPDGKVYTQRLAGYRAAMGLR